MKILEIKGYEYKKHLSTGGEGEVHLIQSADKELIAKIFSKLSEDSIEILNTIKDLNIKGIPQIYEIFDYEDKTILVRDFVEGTTLYDEIKKNEFLTLKRAKTIITSICHALQGLHNTKPNPIIYRDLKPENIIVTPEGNIHLIDFGIARYYKMESARDTVLAGTKGYTAPEVMAGMQSDIRSDVYSVGLLFYEMLTGKNLLAPPFQVRPVRESNEYLPEWLDDIIEKATDLNQTNRYKSIEEFLKAIESPIKSAKVTKEKRVIKYKNSVVYKILAGILSMCIICIALYSFKDRLFNKEEYETILEFEFEYKSDTTWFEVWDENVGDEVLVDWINNGVLTLEVGNVVSKQLLQAGRFIHMQVVYPDLDRQGPAILIDLSEDKYIEDCEMEFFRFYTDNLRPIYLGVNKKTEFSNINQVDTAMMIQGDMRVDIIIWLDEEDQSLRYFVFDSNDESNICYLGVTLMESLQNQNWRFSTSIDTGGWNGTINPKELYTDIEFIKILSGSIKKYMEENIHSYETNKDRIDNFIDSSVPHMNSINYYPYDK